MSQINFGLYHTFDLCKQLVLTSFSSIGFMQGRVHPCYISTQYGKAAHQLMRVGTPAAHMAAFMSEIV